MPTLIQTVSIINRKTSLKLRRKKKENTSIKGGKRVPVIVCMRQAISKPNTEFTLNLILREPTGI